jgi:hypothetical protein
MTNVIQNKKIVTTRGNDNTPGSPGQASYTVLTHTLYVVATELDPSRRELARNTVSEKVIQVEYDHHLRSTSGVLFHPNHVYL